MGILYYRVTNTRNKKNHGTNSCLIAIFKTSLDVGWEVHHNYLYLFSNQIYAYIIHSRDIFFLDYKQK